MKKMIMMVAMIVMAANMSVKAQEVALAVDQEPEVIEVEEEDYFDDITWEMNYALKNADEEEFTCYSSQVNYDERTAKYNMQLRDGSKIDLTMKDEKITFYMYNGETDEVVIGVSTYATFCETYLGY